MNVIIRSNYSRSRI